MSGSPEEPLLRSPSHPHPSTLVGPRQRLRWLFSPNTLMRKQALDDALTSEASSGEGGEEPTSEDKGLSKVLTVWDILAYGVAFTVGAGIFVTTGVVAKKSAGPAIVLSFLSAGIASLLSAFCYAEFGARIPVSGSAYTFAYVALGEFIAWLIGWNLTLEYAISGSAVARGWAGYVVSLFKTFGVTMPYWLHNWVPSPVLTGYLSFSILSYVITTVCTAILLFGAKKSSTFNKIITVVNLGVILFVIILGFIHVEPANWQPFFPFAFSGVFRGAGTVFFSYIGFDSVTTLASESKNPKRDLPIGIIGTLVLATVVYVAVSLAVTGIVPYYTLNEDAPLAAAFDSIGLHWAAGIIAAGSVTTLTATTLASLLSQPRIFMQMSRDGLFFKKFSNLSSTQIPVFGTLVTGYGAGLLAFCLDLGSLTDMISIGTLMAFTVVCGGVILLRLRPNNPDEYIRQYGVCKCVEPIARFSQKFASYILIVYSLVIIGLGLAVKEEAPVWVLGLIGGVAFFLYLMVQSCRHLSMPPGFKAPLVPLLPMIGMMTNIYLITQLDYAAILRVLIWSVAGCLIYFFYGAWHSRQNDKLSKRSLNSDDDMSVAKLDLTPQKESGSEDKPAKPPSGSTEDPIPTL